LSFPKFSWHDIAVLQIIKINLIEIGFLLLLVLISAFSTSAEVVSYIDKTGKTHYVDSEAKVPKQYKQEIKSLGNKPARTSILESRDQNQSIKSLIWYKSSSIHAAVEDPIGLLHDSSKNSYHARQSNAQAQPTLSIKNSDLKLLKFNGSNYLEIDDIAPKLRAAEGLTIFFVVKVTKDLPQYIFSLQGPKKNNDIFRIGFAKERRLRLTFSESGKYYDSDSQLIAGKEETKKTGSNSLAIYTVILDKERAQYYRNSKKFLDIKSDKLPDLDKIQFVSIGQEWDKAGPSAHFHGYLAEFVIYDRVRDLVSRIEMEQKLAKKYRIVLE